MRRAEFQAIDHSGSDFPLPDWLWSLADGTPLRLRAIRSSDAAALGQLFASLDAGARRRRFHGAVNIDSPAWLARMTQVDASHGCAVVVEARCATGCILVAEARLGWRAGADVADFGITVATPWQRRGIGREVLHSLMALAACRGFGALRGHVVADNAPMQALAAALDFRAACDEDGPCFRATLQPARQVRVRGAGIGWAASWALLAGLRRLRTTSATV